MKLLRILSFVAILGLAFTSCSKDDSNDQPTPAKKQLVKISSTTSSVGSSRIDTDELSLIYNSNGQISEFTESSKQGEDPVRNRFFKFKYNGQGKVSQILETNGSNTILAQLDIAYSGTQRTFLATSFDDLGRASEFKVEQELNSNGQPIKQQEFSYENNAWVKDANDYSVFEWSNGNLIKQTDYRDGEIKYVKTYQYNDKVNNGLNKDALWLAGDAGEFLEFVRYMHPSKNSISVEKYESKYSSDDNYTETYKYTYDANDNLVKTEVSGKDGYNGYNTTIEYAYK